jgi:hypothetical protein
MQSGPVGEYPNRFIADAVRADLVVGAGTLTETNPQVILRLSNDDGRSWSSEIMRPIGSLGDYRKQVSFRSLGESGQAGMRFELSMSAAVGRCLMDASLTYTPAAP